MTADPWDTVDRMAARAFPVDPEAIRAEEREACARRIEAWVAARMVTEPSMWLRGARAAADVVRGLR